MYTSQVHRTFHCGHTCVRIRGVHNGNVVLEMGTIQELYLNKILEKFCKMSYLSLTDI